MIFFAQSGSAMVTIYAILWVTAYFVNGMSWSTKKSFALSACIAICKTAACGDGNEDATAFYQCGLLKPINLSIEADGYLSPINCSGFHI